jgi:hypothetical protein
MRAAGRRGIPARGHPIQLHRTRAAQHQAEHPPAMHTEPVAGQLLTADLLLHQPPPMPPRAGAPGHRGRTRGARAVPIPPHAPSPGDDRLAPRIPPRIHPTVIATVIFTVKHRSDLEQRRRGMRIRWQRCRWRCRMMRHVRGTARSQEGRRTPIVPANARMLTVDPRVIRGTLQSAATITANGCLGQAEAYQEIHRDVQFRDDAEAERAGRPVCKIPTAY